MYSRCTGGDLLCGECKEILIGKVNRFLKKHQKGREKAKDNITKFVKKIEVK
jgi:Tryptophanyl-tRNA synthetase